jgi:glutathione S-transferase
LALKLYFHPLSSFCQKVLIGLYELGVPFEKHCVDLGDPKQLGALQELWPLGKFPVLRDDAAARTVPESTTILEYADQCLTRAGRLVPADRERALQCRLQDRFYDLYVNTPVGKIVTDKLRPEGRRDPFGVEQARSQLRTAYDIAEQQLQTSRWAGGDEFGLADCAAAPALFFANKIAAFAPQHRHLAAYFERLVARPSVARTLQEAAPYLVMFPG